MTRAEARRRALETAIRVAGGRDPFVAPAADLLLTSGCTVRKWKKGSSGMAYCGDPDWSIDVPPPRGPVAFGVLAHEVAHQLFHRSTGKRPWQQELEAEEWALAQFGRYGLSLADEARYRQNAARHVRHKLRQFVRGRPSPSAAHAALTLTPEWVWVYHDRREALLDFGQDALRVIAAQHVLA